MLFERFAEDTENAGNLLELATGTGLISLKLSERIPNIIATDLAPEMLRIAREKAAKKGVQNIEFQEEDICALRFPNNSFDTIIASNVLHLLFEPDKAIREMRRVLKNKGRIIVPTYCHGNSLLSHMVSRVMSLSGFRARSRWSVKSFTRFIENNGFEIVKHETLDDIIPMIYLVAKKACPKA